MAIRVLPSNGGKGKQNKGWVITTKSVVRCIKIPEFLTTSEAKRIFAKLDAFLAFDNKKALEYADLLDFTEQLFSQIDFDHSAKLFDLLTNKVDAYDIQKNVELKHKTSSYIDRTPKQFGNFFENSRSVEANDEQVDIKIGILIKYKSWLIENKSKLNNMSIDNVFDYEYNGMFAISPLKGNFSAEDLQSVTSKSQNKERHKYDLKNLNIYHEVTGELLQTAKQHEYNTDFLLTLKGLYVLDVEDFLNHQYKNSGERNKFYQYVKYAALNTEIIKGEGKKEAIRDWLEMNKKHTPTDTEKFEFQNNFDDTQLNVVYEHFKHRLVDKGYLTLETLHSFLKMAFEEQKKPLNKIQLKGQPKKQTIRRIFYSFYSEAAGKPHREKLRYASLLGDYFLGYDTGNIMTNFSK